MLPGRLAVRVLPDGGPILIHMVTKTLQERYMDKAVRGVAVASGVADVPEGSTVMLVGSHGLHITHSDYSWVPEGEEWRLYGVSCSAHDSILGLITDAA